MHIFRHFFGVKMHIFHEKQKNLPLESTNERFLMCSAAKRQTTQNRYLDLVVFGYILFTKRPLKADI